MFSTYLCREGYQRCISLRGLCSCATQCLRLQFKIFSVHNIPYLGGKRCKINKLLEKKRNKHLCFKCQEKKKTKNDNLPSTKLIEVNVLVDELCLRLRYFALLTTNHIGCWIGLFFIHEINSDLQCKFFVDIEITKFFDWFYLECCFCTGLHVKPLLDSLTVLPINRNDCSTAIVAWPVFGKVIYLRVTESCNKIMNTYDIICLYRTKR